jgi:CheY-like chemotaxis protein
MADRSQLEQTLLNLAVNARDAMTSGGTLRFSTGIVQIDEAEGARRGWTAGRYAHLAVSDTGVGMDEDTRTRVFEPFFTTKPPGQGTGLGLSTVYGSVSQSGGYVTVTSAPGHGATFDVYLPSVPDAPRRQGDCRDADGLAARTGETILVVEDEPSVRGLVERVLIGAGYHVMTATDGIQALETAAAHGGDLHLLLTDVVLPGVSGMTVAERLRAGSPALKVLYMSGYSEEMHGRTARGASDRRLLQKPFSPGLLLQGVRRALDDPPD